MDSHSGNSEITDNLALSEGLYVVIFFSYFRPQSRLHSLSVSFCNTAKCAKCQLDRVLDAVALPEDSGTIDHVARKLAVRSQ